jgi:prepilin-type N-terminal cleavage/methylation domain-containing protein
MRSGGFTLIELLIAMTITLVIAGAIAGVAPSARAAFDRVPAELDLQQRGRTAIDVLSQAIRSAGMNVGDLLPAVSVSEPDESGAFAELTAIVPVTDAGQGVLSGDQSGPGDSMTLSTARCPNVNEVCGFTTGTTAVVADGAGHYDVFAIAATNAGEGRVTPASALSRAYPAGSVVVEVDQLTFSLALQPDGSHSLIRQTAAGAIQPIVDFVSGLSFDVSGRDAPAGFFRLDQVDLSIGVEPPTALLRQLIPGRVFRTSIRLRNAS